MMNINRINFRRDCYRVLDLQSKIEDKTGEMFHVMHPELDRECAKVLDGEIFASFTIEKLCKIIDSIEEKPLKASDLFLKLTKGHESECTCIRCYWLRANGFKN